MYNINCFKLTRQCAKIPLQRDYTPNLKKLTDLEELVIIKYIFNLDSRGFSPKYSAIRDIAN